MENFLSIIKNAVSGKIHNDEKVQELTPTERREARKTALTANPWWLAGRKASPSPARADRRRKAAAKRKMNVKHRAGLAAQTLEAQCYADKRALVLVRKYEADNGLPTGGAAASLYDGKIPAGGVEIFEVADGLGLIAADLAAEEAARVEAATR